VGKAVGLKKSDAAKDAVDDGGTQDDNGSADDDAAGAAGGQDIEAWKQAYFAKCGEFTINPSFYTARRLASQAYWDFDKALQLAEKKVGQAARKAVIHGA